MNEILLDVPIERAEQDVLGRTVFAQSVAGLILSAPRATSSQVIGLYGKWGEGKTSVKNLLLETYKTQCTLPPLIVEFSPWTYTSRERLPFLFFCEIAHKLGLESADEKAQNLSTQFKSLGMILDVISNIPALNVISGVAKPIIDHFGTTYSDQASDLTATRKHIYDLLADEPRRLIVVIDDLDRISAEEVRRMIQLVKANGDFPNITYLLLCDRDYVSRALCTVVDGCTKDDGREYLEKVVHFGIDLPRIRTYALRNFLISLIQDVLSRHSVERAEFDVETEFPPLVFQLVHDLRDVKRLVAGFEFQLSTHRKISKGTANIHLGDLIVLEAYRLFEPNFFHALYQNGAELMCENSAQALRYLDKEHSLSEVWFNEQLFSKLSPRSAHTGDEFVQNHLGWLSTGDKFVRDDAANSRIACRLMHPDCFDSYFTLFVDPSLFFKSDHLTFTAALADKDNALTVIRNLFENGRLRDFLSNIEGAFTVDDPVKQENFVSALTFTAEFAQDNLPDMHVLKGDKIGFSLTTHLARCVRFFLERDLRSTEDRSALLMKVFKAEPTAIVLPTSLLSAEHASRSRQAAIRQLLTDAHYEELRQLCISRIEAIQESGKLIGHVTENELRQMWLSIGDPHRLRKLLEADFKVYPNVIHALLPFLGWSSSERGTFYTINLNLLEKMAEPTSILQFLSEHKDLQPIEMQIRDCLAFAIEAKRNNQPYDHDAQMRSVYKRGL